MVSQQVYKEHALSNKDLNNFLKRSLGNVFDMPVCPKCETLGLRTDGWRETKTMRCPKCGYWGPTTKTYGEFLEEELFK